jgi:bifunctional DNA-binding transcriptional regulator/antitoxin component of YhaV-PrlF toxin-antitoxin module
MKTTITKEREQYRTTIPKKLLEESKNGKGDAVKWDLKRGKLSAKVMSNKEFLKLVKDESSLPSQTKGSLAPESQEDFAVYTEGEQDGN